MLLDFHYKLSGKFYRARIPVKFEYLSKKSELYSGVVDTGSPNIVINSNIADEISLKRSTNTSNWKSTSGRFKVRSAIANLIIKNEKRIQKFQNIPIFVCDLKNSPKLPLIGRYPLFEWYNLNFDNKDRMLHLIPK